MRTLVLGGGISGLLAAWRLQREGGTVELWEASDAFGGWSQTLSWPGPQGEEGWIERGPQSLLWKAGSAVDRLLRELEIPFQRLVSRKPRWIGRNHRLKSFPRSLQGWVLTGALSPLDKARVLLEPFQPFITAEEEEDLESFIARRLGSGFARKLLPALCSRALAAPPSFLSVDAIPTLRRLEAQGSLFKGFLREGLEERVLPEGGMGTLAQRLALLLPRALTGLRAEGLRSLPDSRWRVTAADRILEVDQVLLALPAFEAARLLAPVANEPAKVLSAFRYADVENWHSRHDRWPKFSEGFSLLLDPAEGEGILGCTAAEEEDPRNLSGWMQCRTFTGGTFAEPPPETWDEVLSRLRGWFPELPSAIHHRRECAPRSIPNPAPGEMKVLREAVMAMPPGLEWIGTPRFGIGLREIIEAVESWKPQKNTV